jgi:hypothetical protein
MSITPSDSDVSVALYAEDQKPNPDSGYSSGQSGRDSTTHRSDRVKPVSVYRIFDL